MKNLSLSLIAAVTFASGGLAVAQSNPPTSTPGAGCTATANAMKGGNLGGTATNKDCVTQPTAAAAVVRTQAPMAATSPSTTQAPMATTQAAAPMAAEAPTRRMRVARADRN